MKLLLLVFILMSLYVENSFEWSHRQRGFINIPADFSFGSDSAYNIPDTSSPTNPPQTTPQVVSTTTSRPQTQTSTYPTGTIRTTSSSEYLIYGVKFDCTGKPTGFYRDPKYCDLFHVCVSFVQKKTYPCPQVGGDRFYYDENLRRCESADKNPNGCPSNQYYQQGQQDGSGTSVTRVTTTTQPTEAWRVYVRNKDSFSCNGKQDGFYASNWCNVFYRCYFGIKFEFLCAKQTNGDRLWWNQHSSSQSLPQASAQCGFPCDLNRACTSPGGVLIDNGNTVSDSTSEANRIFSSCSSTSAGSSQSNSTDSQDDYFRLPEADNSCAGQADGTFLPDAKYCNIFHVCLAGKRKDFQCARAVTNQYDLWYNDATKTCEWPCKLKCNKQIFASSGRTASDIQALDRGLNGAECDAASYYLRRWYGRW